MPPPAAAAALLLALAASACGHGRLDWRQPDGTYDPAALNRDVIECEEFTVVNDEKSPFVTAPGARQWGGWGDFFFERCMGLRGWVLTNVPSNEHGARPAATEPPRS
jgi:hypothetical protein